MRFASGKISLRYAIPKTDAINDQIGDPAIFEKFVASAKHRLTFKYTGFKSAQIGVVPLLLLCDEFHM